MNYKRTNSESDEREAIRSPRTGRCHSEGETFLKLRLYVLPEESLHVTVSTAGKVCGFLEISTSEVYERS